MFQPESDSVRRTQEALFDIAEAFLDLCLDKQHSLTNSEKHKLQNGARGALRRARALPELVARGDRDWIRMSKQFIHAAGKLVLEYLGKYRDEHRH